MSETCNSRHFSRLMKSCFPDKSLTITPHPHPPPTNLSAFPDDLLLECLSRLPSSSLPSISLVCRRWSRLIISPCFLLLRRNLHLIHPSVFAFSATESGIYAATLSIADSNWEISFCLPTINSLSLHSIPRVAAIGSGIYIIARNSMLRFDVWTRSIISRSAMTTNRKKFATAVVFDKIYVAGGGGCGPASAVEEYDPKTDTWKVVSNAPRRRYGCIGAAVEGIFYVIGGLKIGSECGIDSSRAAGVEANMYASSMDLYDVEARAWLRSRTLPGGGCVVAACSAGGFVYILASHAVELSFWRFDARRKTNSTFGEWCRIRSPPMPAQIRLDSTVRFSFVGVGDRVVLVQVVGCIDDLLRRSGRSERGTREGLVLVYDSVSGEWSRAADLPEVIRRAACVSVEC